LYPAGRKKSMKDRTEAQNIETKMMTLRIHVLVSVLSF